MTIEIQSYNLKLAEKIIMQKCINENPDCTYNELAKLLGVSARTVYRMVKESDQLKTLKKANNTLSNEFLVNRNLKKPRGIHR